MGQTDGNSCWQMVHRVGLFVDFRKNCRSKSNPRSSTLKWNIKARGDRRVFDHVRRSREFQVAQLKFLIEFMHIETVCAQMPMGKLT